MKWLRKNIWWILFSIPLGLLLLFFSSSINSQPLCFALEFADRKEEFTVFEGDDHIRYLFLPSYAELQNVQILLKDQESITIDNTLLTDGMYCGQFAFNTDYELKDAHGKVSTLRFCKSSNVAAVYVETISGSMKYIDADQNHEERSYIKIVHADGTLECYDDTATIHGRGHSTWGADKKSYALQFSVDTDVFNMGHARNWVLLSNAMDATLLRNKLAFEIAKQAGISWVPEYQYVDLYLNGSYHGLYMLTEKVEIGASRLSIDPENGDFLCKTEIGNRQHLMDNAFTTNAGRTIEILEPKYSSQTEIHEKLNNQETIILSGNDLSQEPTFDLTSWIQRYLIDEISGNADADIASSYFFCSGGTMYAGPVWDYDYAFIDSTQGHYFIANQSSELDPLARMYYRALYANPSFYQRMVEIYETDFLPVLNDMIDHGIDHFADEIFEASEMNLLRWSVETDILAGAQRLKTCLTNRVDFLNQVWLQGEVYHAVVLEQVVGQSYLTIPVKDGALCNTDLLDLENGSWIIKDTLEPFDPAQPIYTRTVLTRQASEEPAPVKDTRIPITYLTIFCGVFLTVLLVLIDIYRKGGCVAKWKRKR